MNDYQRELLKMTRSIVSAFEKHHVNYFAIFGTCLGALRHKGMIPWDEDVDFVVLRKDYELAKSAIREECSKIYFWDVDEDGCCSLTYGRMFWKLNNSYTQNEYRAYVDLFVFDYLSDSYFHRFWKYYWTTVIHHLLARRGGRLYFKEIGVKGLLLRIGELCLSVFDDKQLKGFLHYLSMGHKGNMLTVVPHSDKFYSSPAEFFEGWRIVPFHDFMIRIPANAEGFLTFRYGDWKTLPPVNDRHGNAYYGDEWIVEHPADELRRLDNDR